VSHSSGHPLPLKAVLVASLSFALPLVGVDPFFPLFSVVALAPSRTFALDVFNQQQ